MSLLLKDAFAFTLCILHQEFPFVNTLHKKSFFQLDRLTKARRRLII